MTISPNPGLVTMTTYLLRLQLTRDEASPCFQKLCPDWLTQDNVDFERRMRRNVKKKFWYLCYYVRLCLCLFLGRLRVKCGPDRGVLNKVSYGEAQPRGPAPYPFIYHIWQRKHCSHVPSIDKWYTFRIPSLELCIPCNCCKCIVF